LKIKQTGFPVDGNPVFFFDYLIFRRPDYKPFTC